MFRKTRNSAFTLIELMIATALFSVLLLIFYSIISQSTVRSRHQLDSMYAMGGARRVSEFLSRKLKNSIQVVHPRSDEQEASDYCLIKEEDGSIIQFYFSEQGDFLTRNLSKDDPNPVVLVKKPKSGLNVKGAAWVMRVDGVLEFYLKYVLSSNQQEEVVALFDSFALR